MGQHLDPIRPFQEAELVAELAEVEAEIARLPVAPGRRPPQEIFKVSEERKKAEAETQRHRDTVTNRKTDPSCPPCPPSHVPTL